MSSLREWMAAPAVDPREYDPFGQDSSWNAPARELFSDPPTRLEYFAALLAMDTGGYGMHTGGGLYGIMGLDMHQAHVWWELKAFVRGWLAGTGHAEAGWLEHAIAEEHARVKIRMDAIRNEALARTTEPAP